VIKWRLACCITLAWRHQGSGMGQPLWPEDIRCDLFLCDAHGNLAASDFVVVRARRVRLWVYTVYSSSGSGPSFATRNEERGTMCKTKLRLPALAITRKWAIFQYVIMYGYSEHDLRGHLDAAPRFSHPRSFHIPHLCGPVFCTSPPCNMDIFRSS